MFCIVFYPALFVLKHSFLTDKTAVLKQKMGHVSVKWQDSAAVQILLEICLPTSEEQQLGASTESLLRSNLKPVLEKTKQGSQGPKARVDVEDAEPEGGLLSDLREVQCLICCLLHQMFIADPNIAKLVHFQVNPPSFPNFSNKSN